MLFARMRALRMGNTYTQTCVLVYYRQTYSHYIMCINTGQNTWQISMLSGGRRFYLKVSQYFSTKLYHVTYHYRGNLYIPYTYNFGIFELRPFMRQMYTHLYLPLRILAIFGYLRENIKYILEICELFFPCNMSHLIVGVFNKIKIFESSEDFKYSP